LRLECCTRMVSAVVRPQALSKRRQSSALVLIGCVATFSYLESGLSSPCFVFGRPPAATTAGIARRAEAVELEAPPSDEEIAGESPEYKDLAAAEDGAFIEKKWIRGTIAFDRRETMEEAERLQPIIEPLIFKDQLSLKELVFVLNRQGIKLRHLLRKPPMGLPVFSEKKVVRLLQKMEAKTHPLGLPLRHYLRPETFPPHSPAAYRGVPQTVAHAYIEPTFEEVPAMEPLSEETLENWKQIEAADPVFERFPDRLEKVPVEVIKANELEENLVKERSFTLTGIHKIDQMNRVRKGRYFLYTGETEDIHKAESERVMRMSEAARDEYDEEDDEEDDE